MIYVDTYTYIQAIIYSSAYWIYPNIPISLPRKHILLICWRYMLIFIFSMFTCFKILHGAWRRCMLDNIHKFIWDTVIDSLYIATRSNVVHSFSTHLFPALWIVVTCRLFPRHSRCQDATKASLTNVVSFGLQNLVVG